LNFIEPISINESFKYIISEIEKNSLPLSPDISLRDRIKKLDNIEYLDRIPKPEYSILIDEIYEKFTNLSKTIYGLAIKSFLDIEADKFSENYLEIKDFWSAMAFNAKVSESRLDALTIVTNHADSSFDLNPIIEDINDFYKRLVFDVAHFDKISIPPKLDIEVVRSEISEFWIDRDHSLDEDIPRFIARVYKKFIGNGLTRAHLKIDKTLYSEQAKWLSKNGGEFPKWLNVPKAYKSQLRAKPTPTEISTWRDVEAYRASVRRGAGA